MTFSLDWFASIQNFFDGSVCIRGEVPRTRLPNQLRIREDNVVFEKLFPKEIAGELRDRFLVSSTSRESCARIPGTPY